MSRGRVRFIMVVSALLAIGSVWRATVVERAKRQLASAYEQAQEAVRQLERERSHLNEELVTAHETIDEQAGDLTGLQGQLQNVKSQLDETSTELASIEREHQQLREQHVSLTSELDSVRAEKEQLEAKLSSLKELRLAMRDVKQKIRGERWAAWRARVHMVREHDLEQLAAGNRGFLVRNGLSTLDSGPRLHVQVLEPQSQ